MSTLCFFLSIFSLFLSFCSFSNVPFYSELNPFIFYTRLIRRSGCGGAGAYPSGHRERGGVHPGQVAGPSQGHTETNETNNHTRSHSLLRTILETPINLTCMILDSERKPEYPKRTHAYSGRTCKLHTERLPEGSWNWNPLAVRRRCFRT